jgi:DNA-binding MarR family transcriptional regulator
MTDTADIGARRGEQAKAIAGLLERVGRLAHVSGYCAGLNPSQWAALRYFSRANSSQRTATGFARANGTTIGTATQTIAALVRKGYLTRIASTVDRRVTRLDLTPEGETLLVQDPLAGLVTAVAELPPEVCLALSGGLAELMRRLAIHMPHLDGNR